MITLTPTEDGTYTGNRDIKVMGTMGDKDIAPAIVSLNDKESAPTIELEVAPTTMAEEGGTQMATLTAKLSHSAGKDTEVAITASKASDMMVGYELVDAPEKIVVPAGKTEMSADFMVKPDDDDSYKGDATITFTYDPDAVATGDESVAEIELVDDDFDIHLKTSPDFIKEDGGEQSVVVTASLPDGETASSAITLTLNLENAPEARFPFANTMMAGTTSITIGGGSNHGSSTITLTPTADTEGSEVYTGDRTLELSGTSGSLSIASTEISLKDAESLPGVTLTVAPEEMDEATTTAVTVTVTATLDVRKDIDATVKVSVAKTDSRYTLDLAEFEITIPSKELLMTGQFEFTAKANDDYTGDITIPITGDAGKLAVKDTEIKLIDEDFDISLSAGGPVVEGNGTQSVVVTAMIPGNEMTDDAVTVALGFERPEGETATSLAIGGTTSITIAGGGSSATAVITVTPTEDKTFTGLRTIKVTGTSGDMAIKSTTIALEDAESAPSVTLEATPETLTEEGGEQTVTVKATLSHLSAKDTELAISVSEEATDTEGVSYKASDPEKIVVPAGKTEMTTTFTVTPDDNSTYDGNREITVTYDPDANNTGNEVTDKITLIDDDFDINMMVSPMYIEEDGETQSVMVSAVLPDGKTADAATTVVVRIEAPTGWTVNANGTDSGNASSLFVSGTLSVTIGEGASKGSTVITIKPYTDNRVTGNQKLMVEGTLQDFSISPATLTMRDAQRVSVALSTDLDPAEIMENGGPTVVMLTATQDDVLLSATEITLAKDQGSAVKDEDFLVTDVSGDLIIPSGETSATISLTIEPIDDMMAEGGSENIVISGSAGNFRVSSTTIALLDNNRIPLEYVMVDVHEIAEDDSAGTDVMVTVRLAGTSNDTTYIGLDKSMGTATPGDDFDVVVAEDAPAFMIAPMDSMAMKMVTIVPINDDEIEGQEEILVSAWAIDSEMMQIDPVVTTGIVMTDDDSLVDLPLVALSVDNNTFVEGVDGTITVTATANGAVPVPQVIALAPVLEHTTIDLADAPALFTKFATPPGVTITILPGQLTGEMVIPISTVDDMVFEGDEVATLIGVVVSTQSNTNPFQIILVDNDAPTVALTPSTATLSESGGAQRVTFTAEMTSGAVESPTEIHLSVVDGTASSADYSAAGGMISIPAGMTSGSAELTITVNADEQYEPSNETIVVSAGYRTHVGLANVPLTITDDFAAPAVVSGLPSISIEAGENWTGDVASSFTGKALTYSASSSGDAASASVSGSALTITGERKGAARVTVTAMNAAGNASFEMDVSVTATAAEQMVYTDILAAMGRNVMSSVSQTIGGRFSVGAAERQIALANRRVDGMASGMETLISLSGTQATTKYGITDESTRRFNRQPVSTRDLVRGSSFYYALDDAPDNHMGGGLEWTIWGAGDWNAFEGAPTASSSYEGTLTSGYVGLDVSKSATWIAGVAVGRTMGTADYDVTVTDGTLETTLNSVYPYVHWTGPGCCVEVWAVGGFGTGEAEVSEMTSDLSMSLGMVGLRAQLVGGASGGLDLDLIGDAGITKLSTSESGSASLSDLEASVQRARVGLEASRTSDMGNGMLVTPFAQVAGRYDGGDGQTGNGLEVAGGLRIAGGRAGLEARGRLLAMHTGEEVKEHGVSVVAYVRPMGTAGQGLSMTVAPRLGADTQMSNNLWREEPMSDVRLTSRSGAAVKAEIGYGLVHPMMSSLLVTPFGTMDMAGNDQRRMRLGARFGSIGDTTSVLSFELAGERIQRSGRSADHRIGLLGRMSF